MHGRTSQKPGNAASPGWPSTRSPCPQLAAAGNPDVSIGLTAASCAGPPPPCRLAKRAKADARCLQNSQDLLSQLMLLTCSPDGGLAPAQLSKQKNRPGSQHCLIGAGWMRYCGPGRQRLGRQRRRAGARGAAVAGSWMYLQILRTGSPGQPAAGPPSRLPPPRGSGETGRRTRGPCAAHRCWPEPQEQGEDGGGSAVVSTRLPRQSCAPPQHASPSPPIVQPGHQVHPQMGIRTTAGDTSTEGCWPANACGLNSKLLEGGQGPAGAIPRRPHYCPLPLAFSRYHYGREFGEVGNPSLGVLGLGSGSHRVPNLCTLEAQSCPHSQAVVEELEVQRGRATCLKSNGEAGPRPHALTSVNSESRLPCFAPAGQPALAAEGAPALRPPGQADPCPVPCPARAAPAGCQRLLPRRLLGAPAGGQ